MSPEQGELFASVDALLEKVAAQDSLPEAAERKRLREAAGVSQDQIAKTLKVRRETVTAWESGRAEPRAPKRAAYVRLLDGLAALHPAPPVVAEPEPTPPAPSTPQVPAAAQRVAEPVAEPAAVPVPVSVREPAAPPPPAAPAPASPRRPAPARRPQALAPAPGVDPRFANGPLAVVDGDGSAYCLGGLVLECPADDIPSLVQWALTDARLGAARLHRSGKDADPLVVLTESATIRFGLPVELADRRGLRLPEDHEVVRRVARAGWQLTRRGFGPWARIYRPAQAGQRQCVQLAVLPWGALDGRSWGSVDQAPPAEVARVLGAYATRVITPRGSTAVCGLELMTNLRPPTRAVRDEATGEWVSGAVPGALGAAVDPAPPEAPDEHPVVAQLHPRGHQRTPDQVLDEEAYDWIRDPQLLGDDECAKPYAVGIDVNMAFAAAANRLTVGLGAPVHRTAPAFDKALPGCWLVDLSGIDLDPRLPSPFTPQGNRPAGPAWYATPTVAYAVELGHDVQPVEAYVRPETGAYLDAWYTRLRDAYLATMGQLGVTAGMDEADFLAAMAAMAAHKDADPGLVAVLSAVKATVKGGIGKLRERPQGAGYRPGERWSALDRPTWRPDIRAAVISSARVNMHRKMRKFAAVGLYPLAVLSDCAVYAADGPSPLDVLPRTPDGKPLPGGFRLGVSPGMVKHEGTQDLMWAVELLDQGHNPARHIKGTDAAVDGE